jgi:hypothetical protein
MQAISAHVASNALEIVSNFSAPNGAQSMSARALNIVPPCTVASVNPKRATNPE